MFVFRMNIKNNSDQNFLIDSLMIKKLLEYSSVTEDDCVYEIGTGKGKITQKLCQKAKFVTSSELDKSLYNISHNKLSSYNNLDLLHMDGFQYTGKFDVFVSSLPYSESRRFIYWLINKNFKNAVVILQKEFIDKITSPPNNKNYRPVSVISQYCLDITLVEILSPSCFDPPPKIQSTMIVIKPRNSLQPSEIYMIKKLFSSRRKQLHSILYSLTNNDDALLECNNNFDLSKRIYEFNPTMIISLVKILGNYDLL